VIYSMIPILWWVVVVDREVQKNKIVRICCTNKAAKVHYGAGLLLNEVSIRIIMIALNKIFFFPYCYRLEVFCQCTIIELVA
jgi:hypothetical protein